MDVEFAENIKAGLMSMDNQPLQKGFVGPASQACSELERANETQTQEATQIPEFPTEQVRHKRGGDVLTEPDILTRPTKKLKISVAVGIDLAEWNSNSNHDVGVYF